MLLTESIRSLPSEYTVIKQLYYLPNHKVQLIVKQCFNNPLRNHAPYIQKFVWNTNPVFYFFRFCEGLSCLGVLQAVQVHPSLEQFFLGKPPKITAAQVLELFEDRIKFSEVGSNRNLAELETMAIFQDYLNTLEGININTWSSDIITNST